MMGNLQTHLTKKVKKNQVVHHLFGGQEEATDCAEGIKLGERYKRMKNNDQKE